MKLLIYCKYRDPENNPLDVEFHYWSVEAENSDRALEIAEKSPFVPWRDYLVGVIDSGELDAWMTENDVEPDNVYSHVFS